MFCQKVRVFQVINKLRTIRYSDCFTHQILFSHQPAPSKVQQKSVRLLFNSKHLAGMAGQSSSKHTNRLAQEKSPYLLQHAHNPVDWYPWGQEAFAKAKKENKLIFLSVGYSTCHWCHVMERESFEDEGIAKIMNENFVCVKVDREERPDVDKIYMTFVQALSGRGGWPMSVWLSPELTPLAGGTYYPPRDRFGQPGFPSMLVTLSKKWKENREKFSESGQKVMEVLQEASMLDNSELEPSSTQPPGPDAWNKCFQQLSKSFEPRFGGFGDAPKFPQPVNLNFLLHFYSKQPDSETGKKALSMCSHTLEMMSKGGIHDHISNGFARYSTDDKWHVPHFEKMLYDQGQLAVAFSNAFVATKNPLFADMVEDILTYVSRDLSHPSGGFYSAEDADSLPKYDAKEKKEGAFCVWTSEEIQNVLNKEVQGKPGLVYADVFSHHFEVKPGGNVNPRQDPHNELKNQNVLIVFGSEAKTAEKFDLTVETVRGILEECKSRLYDVRAKRPRPHLDDKMLTAWNGLMISGFARAGQVLNSRAHVERAVSAAKFIQTHLYNVDRKTLLRSCYNGEGGTVSQIGAPINGFLDDYAFLIRGLLDLYEASFDSIWVEWAENLQQTQDSLFWDDAGAGYFTSPAGDPTIVIRMKEDQDGAEPSGNSVSVHNLLRLDTFLGKPGYRDKAGRILAAFTSRLTRVPLAVPEMVSGLMFYHDGATQIFITGRKDDSDTAALLETVQSRLLPARVMALADGDEESILYKQCDVVKGMKPVNGQAAAYVCRHHVCSLPVTSKEDLTKLLEDTH